MAMLPLNCGVVVPGVSQQSDNDTTPGKTAELPAALDCCLLANNLGFVGNEQKQNR
jgi:hypothetical protein